VTAAPLLAPILRHLGACDGPEQVIAWAGQRKVSRATYYACDRGDWLLWLAARIGVNPQIVVEAACDCVELVLKNIPDNEDRPRRAVELTRSWCQGRTSLTQVQDAAEAAKKASLNRTRDTAAAARAAAWQVAWAVGDTGWAAAAVWHVAEAIAWAVDISTVSIGEIGAVREGARLGKLKHCAQLVRKRIPFETMRDAVLAVEISP